MGIAPLMVFAAAESASAAWLPSVGKAALRHNAMLMASGVYGWTGKEAGAIVRPAEKAIIPWDF
jgi:hypothetical protein